MLDKMHDLLWGEKGLFGRPSATNVPTVPLKLHNSLSGETEPFIPLGGSIKMYNCGPTVYSAAHIGNLRGAILSDVLRRTLLRWGHYVRHVSNITDVGHLTGDNAGDADTGVDRMEASAQKEGLSAQEIAQHYTDLYFKDLDMLGIDRSKIVWAPATQYIDDQIALVKTLEEKGYTYVTSDGVYFNTAKFPSYGQLGNINLAGQEAGARVEVNTEKKNPHDFAVWKFSPKGEKRQQEWKSPWGVGFPGWHLECTAIIFTLLGKQIDIHIGGRDLAPIHHNNEIAQAEAASGKKPFVKYWMHNEFITVEGKRVSKSLGNTVYLHNLVDKGLNPQSLRYWYLSAHYRTPINFTWDSIAGADQALTRLNRFFTELSLTKRRAAPDKKFMDDMFAALADDLDTPKVIARMWELIKDQSISAEVTRATLLEVDAVLGLGFTKRRPTTKLKVSSSSSIPQEVKDLMRQREEARANKNFTSADLLRDKIEALGYEVLDSSEGSTLKAK